MKNSIFLRSHVELNLQRLWDLPSLITDPDGDYPFAHESAACYVQVSDEHKLVRVLGVAAKDVPYSAKLLKELNEVNGHAMLHRVFYSRGQVLVTQVLPAEAVSVESLGDTCAAVGTVAAHLGSLLVTVYGGSTPLGELVTTFSDGDTHE